MIDRSQLTAANFEQNIAPRLENLAISDDVQQRANWLTDIVDASACELVTDKMVTIAYKKRWFNDYWKRMRRERNVAESKAELNNDQSDWNDYRNKRNMYNRHLKRSKNEDLISIITSCEGDQKKCGAT